MAYVQADKQSSASASALTTPGLTTTTGNILVAVMNTDNGPKTLSSIVDSKSNTWTALTGNPQTSNGGFNIYCYYAVLTSGGASHTVTANFSGASQCSMSVFEFSGRDTASPILFQSAKTDGAGATSHTSTATGTLGASGSDLICVVGDNALSQAAANETYTATSSGWTLPAAGNVNTGATTTTCFGMYKENVTTSSDQAAWTNSAGNLIACSFIVALAAAAGGGGGSNSRLLLLGVG